jgi:GntR family transcriptional regulator
MVSSSADANPAGREVIMSAEGLPLYYIVRETIRREIATSMKPGDQLLTEPKLMKRMGVSRITIRHALEQLRAEGLITRAQGRGTFVAFPSVRPNLRGLYSFLNDIAVSGQIPSTKAIRVERMRAPPDVYDRLGLSNSSPLICVEKIRLANDTPVSLEKSFILPEIAGRWTKRLIERNAIFEIEKAQGVRLSRGSVEIAACCADATVAHHLRIVKGAALLRVERVVYDHANRPVEYDILLYRADRVRYGFETQSETASKFNPDARTGFKLVASGARS